MTKKSKISIVLFTLFLVIILVGWLIANNQAKSLSLHKQCARCGAMEDWEVQHHSSLPYYKGIVTITADKSLQFTEQPTGQIYTVNTCDRACGNDLYKQVAGHYQFMQKNKDTLWLGIWGLKGEGDRIVEINAYAVLDHEEAK